MATKVSVRFPPIHGKILKVFTNTKIGILFQWGFPQYMVKCLNLNPMIESNEFQWGFPQYMVKFSKEDEPLRFNSLFQWGFPQYMVK